MALRYLDVVVLRRRELTSRIVEFCIGAADGSPLPSGEPGSHVEVRFGANGEFTRHYSLVGALTKAPIVEPFWRIAVQREDRARGSAFMHSRFAPGTRLRATRPLAPFRLRNDHPHTLLVAGGIGITPILPMLRSLVLRQRPFSVHYVGSSRADMAYADEVVMLGGQAVTIHDTSRSGRPDLARIAAAQPSGTECYACGPGVMIDALKRVAADAGWAPGRVHSEIFNAAHRPDDTETTVELADGRIVHVGAGTTILDALDSAGVETYADCRRGECGLCVTGVIGGAADIDHRDAYLSDDQKRSAALMCICVSRPRRGARLKLDIS